MPLYHDGFFLRHLKVAFLAGIGAVVRDGSDQLLGCAKLKGVEGAGMTSNVGAPARENY